MALFAIENLRFTYPGSVSPALDGINLTVENGEFLVLCGKSGCGKSTLLRQLKTVLTPHGEREGSIFFKGQPLESATQRSQAASIGFVLQNPDNQIVTDKVWHELAFGLESLGESKEVIRLRVAEMASFFGIQQWYHKSVFELSGGQKQLLNLAAVMTMQPDVLILDEPTAQLDPIAAADFLATIKKINTEIGTTVILSEHRLEEVLHGADRAIVLGDGRIIAEGTPAQVGHTLKMLDDPMLYAMPTPLRVYLALETGDKDTCPVTVREGREYLSRRERQKECPKERQEEPQRGRQGVRQKSSPLDASDKQTVVAVKDAWFRYTKHGEDVLRGLSFTVSRGELFCIVGGNGTGKTTALGIVSGLRRPYRGTVSCLEKGVVVLPQDPQTLFTQKTIREDLLEMLPQGKNTVGEVEKQLAEVVELTEIAALLSQHPYDVSGGEQQRVALAKVLLTEPELLLLDEPTKGMDSFFKRKFARILNKLCDKDLTAIMVSHDLEFCAQYASRCALFFDGSIVTQSNPRVFFSGNNFYTTAANRMSRHVFADAITVEDIVEKCRQAHD